MCSCQPKCHVWCKQIMYSKEHSVSDLFNNGWTKLFLSLPPSFSLSVSLPPCFYLTLSLPPSRFPFFLLFPCWRRKQIGAFDSLSAPIFYCNSQGMARTTIWVMSSKQRYIIISSVYGADLCGVKCTTYVHVIVYLCEFTIVTSPVCIHIGYRYIW